MSEGKGPNGGDVAKAEGPVEMPLEDAIYASRLFVAAPDQLRVTREAPPKDPGLSDDPWAPQAPVDQAKAPASKAAKASAETTPTATASR